MASWTNVTATQALTWVMNRMDQIRNMKDFEAFKMELKDKRERVLSKIADTF